MQLKPTENVDQSFINEYDERTRNKGYINLQTRENGNVQSMNAGCFSPILGRNRHAKMTFNENVPLQKKKKKSFKSSFELGLSLN